MNVVEILAGTLGDTVYPITEAKDFDSFLEWASEEILEFVQEDTPHGECGTDQQTLKFLFEGKYYDVSVTNISWNRFDKQYYYLEMWDEPKIKWVESTFTPATKGLIEKSWLGAMNVKNKKVVSHIINDPALSLTLQEITELNYKMTQKGFDISNFRYSFQMTPGPTPLPYPKPSSTPQK